jgi:hypothetical protein
MICLIAPLSDWPKACHETLDSARTGPLILERYCPNTARFWKKNKMQICKWCLNCSEMPSTSFHLERPQNARFRQSDKFWWRVRLLLLHNFDYMNKPCVTFQLTCHTFSEKWELALHADVSVLTLVSVHTHSHIISCHVMSYRIVSYRINMYNIYYIYKWYDKLSHTYVHFKKM